MKQFFLSIATLGMFSSAASAQPGVQPMSGTFVLAEEGSGVSQPIASIAILNFASGGTVAGVQIQRSPGSTLKLNAIGTYSLNNDGTGTLALTLTGQAVPPEGVDPFVGSASYHLRWAKGRGVAALRMDTGLFTIGSLSPAADAGLPKGGFIFAERGNGSPYAGLGLLNFDGANAIAGSERITSVGLNFTNNLAGSYSMGADGFGAFTLNIPSTDVDGNVSYSAANYVFAAGAGQILAIRTDGNSAVVSTLTSIQ